MTGQKFNQINSFTLIETIIAISVLSIGIVAVLSIFPLGTHVAKSGQMTTIATNLSQGKMEEEIAKSYDEIIVGTFTENYGDIANFPTYKRVIEINCVRFSDLSVSSCGYDLVQDPDPMKKIEVKVFWQSPLGVTEKSINLINLISEK